MKMYRVNLLVSEREMLRILTDRQGESFTIVFEGDDEAAAPVSTPVSTGAKRGRKPRPIVLEPEPEARDVILSALEVSPMSAIDLSSTLDQAGVVRGKLATTLEELLKEGDIVRRDNGDYAINEAREANQEAAE